MFDRQTSRELESLFAPNGNVQQRVGRQIQGMLLLWRNTLMIITQLRILWDYGFAGKLQNQDGTRLINGLSLRQWRQYVALIKVYVVFTKIPLANMVNLSLPNGNKPFDVFDPLELEELASMSMEQILFTEPDITVPVVVEDPVNPAP